ncbi:MAG: hypothetical protein JWO20_3101, partial [Candidatus Angelobacter sp.]|nr:hypothetical protein [Candidatus Angelobacter sp.]
GVPQALPFKLPRSEVEWGAAPREGELHFADCDFANDQRAEATIGNTDSLWPIQLYVFAHSSARTFLLVTFSGILLSAVPIYALPIKPKIEDVIKEAKKPPEKFVPARAGWNGPEEKSAIAAPNTTYDRLRKSMSPEAARLQLLQAAKPDWRLLLCVTGVIFFWRYKLAREHSSAPRQQGGRPEVVPIAVAPVATRDRQAA